MANAFKALNNANKRRANNLDALAKKRMSIMSPMGLGKIGGLADQENRGEMKLDNLADILVGHDLKKDEIRKISILIKF